ncbi:MAG: hypothetical protein GF334_10410 [Candidatus Altiarchaeales archaeon]|nr:hypothetical protein [Candidatus Altiarchaeales archaeon]
MKSIKIRALEFANEIQDVEPPDEFLDRNRLSHETEIEVFEDGSLSVEGGGSIPATTETWNEVVEYSRRR